MRPNYGFPCFPDHLGSIMRQSQGKCDHLAAGWMFLKLFSDNGSPSRDCKVLESCQGNITFVESPFYSAAMEYVSSVFTYSPLGIIGYAAPLLCIVLFSHRCSSSGCSLVTISPVSESRHSATLTIGPCSDLVGRKPVAVSLLATGILTLMASGWTIPYNK